MHTDDIFEKCSWVLKTKKGAPTFKILSADLVGIEGFDLHYTEYDHTVSLHLNNDMELSNLFVEPNVAGSLATDGSSGPNKLYAAKYNKNAFYNQEKPEVYHLSDMVTKEKRWFPVTIAENMLAN